MIRKEQVFAGEEIDNKKNEIDNKENCDYLTNVVHQVV
jgi:hypothetical protein